ncbi:hypothetical protein FZC74_13930 [Sutcliffiella horikoshii]|uniref:Uncharacterized protein n=1 Tax=Sutcliffiella horikoshii TaxID=79883 RepID=A0AA95B6G2_9BACI|nr:DUF5677 domain-containing protein [Sutcliffiella horikoshii]TYS58089.1 hypothetical protein FZC74_13930 [Sutcliffiella horikoshii]
MKTLNKMCREADKVFEKVMSNHFQMNIENIKFDFADAVILGLLENLINHSKSILILVENKQYSSIDSILRTIFENYVFLSFVLQKNTSIRAKAYLYSTKIKEKHFFNCLIEDTLNGYKLRSFLNVNKEDLKRQFSENFNVEKVREIEEKYISEIGMRRVEQKWYNFDGNTKTFKKLCSNLNFSMEYELIYSILSTETHGKDAISNFSFKENRVDILKKFKNEELHLSLCELYLLDSIRLIYKYYGLKQDLNNFNLLLGLNYKYRK